MSERVMMDEGIGAAVVDKPLLRGYSHAAAAVAAALGTVVLLRLAHGDHAKQLSLLVYGVCAVVLFAVSAIYHIGNWPARRRALLRRLDRANIFAVIAGTYTPVGFNMLRGWWRADLLLVVWGLAALGMIAAAPRLHLSRGVMVALYVTLGWIPLVAIPQVVSALGLVGLFLPAIAGVLFTAGALGYAFQRPRLWPRVFGYHELFHLAVVAGSALLFVFMLQQVVPFVRH